VRFLADESCDVSVVRALGRAGHDVLAIAEISPRADDADVLGLALRDGRILLTEDKDFGQLVYASAHQSAGVILLRFSARVRASLATSVLDLIDRLGARLRSSSSSQAGFESAGPEALETERPVLALRSAGVASASTLANGAASCLTISNC